MGRKVRRCRKCGFKPCRCLDLQLCWEEGTGFGGQQTTTYPMESDALACHPSQVEAMEARNKKHGIRVNYKPDGTAVIPDRGERRRLLRLEGMVDRAGGYGDTHAGSSHRLPDAESNYGD